MFFEDKVITETLDHREIPPRLLPPTLEDYDER
jgi:hypothetical protein